ncbi:MAG TPA: rhodanese-like domain-containing protein [Luteolibacter sp.]|nr:rhodanese-like domain-containing protein [Luteolibacter sp.]
MEHLPQISQKIGSAENLMACCCVLAKKGDDPVMKTTALFIALLTSLGSISIAEDIKTIAPVKIEEAEKQLATGAQLLDVRTKEEWAEGHLKGATLVTATEEGFLEKAKAVLDSKKPVVVYCRSGKRSAKATEQLRANGFTVFDLEGGITAWKAAGKPVEK